MRKLGRDKDKGWLANKLLASFFEEHELSIYVPSDPT
jgi:hypothetical protein